MRAAISLITLLFCINCQNTDQSAHPGLELGTLKDNTLSEISGIACSQNNPALIWAHNDSGDEPRIFALDNQANIIAEIALNGPKARDWEDIAVGPGPENGLSYIFVGDIGDNRAKYELKHIYRFPEPDINGDNFPAEIPRDQIATITFRYPDGPRDAEALMVDPVSKDIFIVSKREEQVAVYRLTFPQAVDSVISAEKLLNLDMTQVTAADVSPSGKHILIKNYPEVYYWSRPADLSLAEALQNDPVVLPYTEEPQGEAIAWHPNENGYYTISEKRNGIVPHLYYYAFE